MTDGLFNVVDTDDIVEAVLSVIGIDMVPTLALVTEPVVVNGMVVVMVWLFVPAPDVIVDDAVPHVIPVVD